MVRLIGEVLRPPSALYRMEMKRMCVSCQYYLKIERSRRYARDLSVFWRQGGVSVTDMASIITQQKFVHVVEYLIFLCTLSGAMQEASPVICACEGLS